MTKQELIEHLADAEDIPFENAEAIVEEFLRLIEDRMKRGEETQIYSFGKFGVRWWKGRTGRDPQTGEEIELEGRWIPYWTPSPSLVDETEEYQAAVEAGKIEEAEAEEESAESEKEKIAETSTVEETSEESAEKEEVASEISSEQPEEVAESTPAGEQVEEQEKTKEEPSSPEQEGRAAEDTLEEEPAQAVEPEKEKPAEEPEPIDSFEPIPEEEVPEEEDEEDEGDTPKIPAFMFRESEEDEEVSLEQDLPDAVESDEQFIEKSEIEDETEKKESEEEPLQAESPVLQESEGAEEEPADVDEDSEPEWERRAREKARSRESEKSREEDMPWLYPEKKKSKNWLPTLLIVILLIGVAGAAYYVLVDRPEFLTNRGVQQIDEPLFDIDQEPPGIDTEADEEEETTLQDEQDAGERASASTSDVPEPETATPIARSISTPENLEPYEFGVAGSGEFMETYEQGLSLFEEGNYREAELIFQRLQISDPPDDYADNTQYWIGECKFGMGQFRESIRAFEEVFIYPNTNKVDDSLIMMASAYIHLNEMQRAGEILRKFQGQYSSSQYAPIAYRWINRYNL